MRLRRIDGDFRSSNTFVFSSLISHFSISSAHEVEVTNESRGENKTPRRGFRVCTYVENAGAHFSINFLQCSGSILRLTFWNLLSARRIRKIATTIERNRGRHVIDLAFIFFFLLPQPQKFYRPFSLTSLDSTFSPMSFSKSSSFQ